METFRTEICRYDPANTDDKGMDLRDHFASKVLQAMLSIQETHNSLAVKKFNPLDLAKASYVWADAMLEARKT